MAEESADGEDGEACEEGRSEDAETHEEAKQEGKESKGKDSKPSGKSKAKNSKSKKSLEEEVEDADAVLLDVDGTLVDRDDAFYAFYKAVCEKRGIKIPSKSSMLSRYANAGHIEIIMGLTSMSESEAARLKAEFQSNPSAYAHYIKVLSGTLRLLYSLKNSGKRIGVVSNARKNEVRKSLEKITSNYNERYNTNYRINDLFQYAVTKDDAKEKPNCEGIVKAIRGLGVNNKKIVMFGDEKRDIEAVFSARKLGYNIKSVASSYHDQLIGITKPDYIVPNTHYLGKTLEYRLAS